VAFLPNLTKKWDKFFIFKLTLFGQMAVCAVGYFAGYGNMPLFYALFVLRGIFSGSTMIMMLMFTADFIEYGQFVTRRRLQATAYSIQTLICKIMTAIAGALVMFMMNAAGFVSGTGVTQNKTTLDVIWLLVAIVPLAGCVLSLIFFLRYDLNDRDAQLMSRANAGEISRDEAIAQFTHSYKGAEEK
jgi:Na+/melibiose symporter-like transporter